MENHLKPALLIVVILATVAFGVDSLSIAYQKRALVAQASTPTEVPTLEKSEIEKICEAKKKEGAASVEAQSWSYTIPFEQKDLTETDKCVGAVFDASSAAAKSAAPGTDPTKNPEAYKCVGKSSRVTISAGGTGTLFSTPSPSFPVGQCMTIYCSSDYPPVCSEAKQFGGTQSVRSMATDPTILKSLTADQRASIVALGPMDAAQQAALDSAFASTPLPNSLPTTPPTSPANPPPTRLPIPPIPPASSANPAPTQLPIPPIPLNTADPVQNSALFDVPGDSVATLNPSESPNSLANNSAAYQKPIVFDPSGNYEQSTFRPASYDAISGTIDPGSVASIPTSDNAIQTGAPDGSLSAIHHDLGTFARVAPIERSAGLVTYPDGSTQYIQGYLGEANSVRSAAMLVDSAVQAGGPGTTGVTIHTHPLPSIFADDPAQVTAVLAGQQPPPTSPPSFTDVRGQIAYAPLAQDSPNTVIGQVVDPSGVWTYQLDSSSPAGQAFVRDYKDTVWSATRGLEDDQQWKAARDTAEASLAAKYPAMTMIHQAGINADINPYLYNNPAMREQLAAQYAAIGFRLTYTPFPTGTPLR